MWRILYCVVLLFTTVNTAGLGEVCSDDADCLVLGLGDSECVRVYGSCEPTCQCDANSYESTELNTCQLVHGCEMVEECTNTLVGSIECNDETNTCECGDGIVPTEYHGTDYCQLALLGDSCGGDENNCLAHLIDPHSAVCDDEWTGGICACNVGWMPEPGYEYVACINYPLGAACIVSESVCIDNAFCSEDDWICVCEVGYAPNEDKICQNEDIPQENLNLPHGETCTTDVTVPEVLLCHTDLVCDECLAGDGLACQIPVKAIGSHCTGRIGADGCDVGMCVKDFSDCTNGHCMCPEGQHATSYTACDDNVPLDGYCTTDLQCDAATHGATCAIPDGEDTAVCSCVDPLQPHEGETPVCYFAAYQENCIESKDCLTYLLNPETGDCGGVLSPKCGCVEGYVIDEDGVECRPYHYGELCDESYKVCEGNSNCVLTGDDFRCLCPSDTTWNYNIKNCLHKHASQHFSTDEECTAHFDEAGSQICEPWLTCGQCSDDGDSAPRLCRDTDELGDDPMACNPNENNACDSHGDAAVCNSFYDHCEDTGVCECKDGYYLDSNWQCVPVGDVWSCVNSDQCDNHIRYSVCDPGMICSCRDEETVHTVGEVQYCAKYNIGEECVSNDDCLSYRVNPAAGVCQLDGDTPGCGCTVDYKPDGEVCVQVSFGEACYSECSGSLVCEMHMVCECPHNTVWHVELGDCVHYEAVHVGPGDACDADYTVAGARICITPEVCAVCYDSADGVGICSERTPSTTPFYEDTSIISLTTTFDEDPSFTRVTTPFDEDPSFTRVTTPFDEDPSFTRVTACEKAEYQFCDMDMMAYDDTTCQLYYVCDGGFWRSGLCQEPTLFDIESFACRPAASATCADFCPPFTGAPHPDPSLEPAGPCPEITGDNCEPQQNYPDRQSCSHYHHCVGAGTILETPCPENTFYNLKDQQCQAPDADFNCYRECETMATDSWGVV